MSEIRDRLDLTSLVAGIAIVVLGTLILLEDEGAIDLGGGWLLAVLAAATGVALVASGMGARRS
jgi:hypothetical protein